ncbi:MULTISPECIES: ABC transporter permease [unclassified Acinetobacter]|uniref:ABC transporter permease n=1 Tax=unclassified Acinetobacter TaxID=196816 RepID=UPI00190A7AB3|nr:MULTISPECIES: ABC transporter permease [unclassified Acinetobacter]MBK0063627.1 ABC transporter permease [Acinetobacter sp. S55]MBK0067505.1 ABC transporter permease [Acinetobacter sp. S54]
MKGSASVLRLAALIRKEIHQLLRDKSSLAIGLILPLILILLFGYGLSFDLNNGRVGVVAQNMTPQSQQLIAGLNGTKYITALPYTSFYQAEQAMGRAEIDAIVNLPTDFAQQSAQNTATIQVITNGRSTTIASALQGYISGALLTAQTIQADRNNIGTSAGLISVEQRMWFNESANSTWFLVPGLIVLVLTLIGAFLTGLLIARERERGTLEALFVTPVRPLEIVLSKLIPYIVIGMIDIVMCLLAASLIFDVPIRGSLLSIISASFLYLLVSLLLGLTISGFSKSQFQASQMALLVSFMPAMMLSGFVFDTRNLPWLIQIISQILPATHFMSLIKTLFLGGDDWGLWLKECGILMVYVVILMTASCRSLRKRLG